MNVSDCCGQVLQLSWSIVLDCCRACELMEMLNGIVFPNSCSQCCSRVRELFHIVYGVVLRNLLQVVYGVVMVVMVVNRCSKSCWWTVGDDVRCCWSICR